MKKNTPLLFSALLMLPLMACIQTKKQQATDTESLTNGGINPVYIGTYTRNEGFVDGKANGIYLMNKKVDGSLEMVKTVAEITNPSFIKISKDGKNLYAVSELGGKGENSGYIYAYKINEDYSLTELGKLSTEALAPCHINIDHTDTYVFVSNYVGGVVMEYKRNDNGNLTKIDKLEINKINPTENTGNSHAHAVTIPANNKFIYVSDLGNDKIWIYDFDQNSGQLRPNHQLFAQVDKGAGPRHFAFSANQNFAYSINELNSTITAFHYNNITGELTSIQTLSTLPMGFKGDNNCAEIAVHPNGKYLYASNRGHNSIAAFDIDQKTGELKVIGHQSNQGEYPRFFTIDNNGALIYVANQNSSTIAVLKIQKDGSLLPSHIKTVKVNTPVCIEFYNH